MTGGLIHAKSDSNQKTNSKEKGFTGRIGESEKVKSEKAQNGGGVPGSRGDAGSGEWNRVVVPPKSFSSFAFLRFSDPPCEAFAFALLCSRSSPVIFPRGLNPS